MGTPQVPPRIDGLVDAHCHLDYAPMADDLEATFAAGAAAGVQQYVHVGCSLGSLDRAVALAAAHPRVVAAIGVHPHEASTVDDAALARIEALAAEPGVVAIGETGLDYFYDRSPRDAQRRALAQHVELARRLDLPLVLHIRDAHDEALSIVAEARPRTGNPGMVHCFTAGPDEARRWLDLGFHISFSGIATFKKATDIRDAAKLVPDDRLLLETDAPYLSPEPLRGRKNQPAHVAFTCARLALERGLQAPRLATLAAANTRALLGMQRPAALSADPDAPFTV
jgi:TatD DNase family protein